jgi:hypothetical protein
MNVADDTARVKLGYRIALNREPGREELERMLRFARTQRDSIASPPSAAPGAQPPPSGSGSAEHRVWTGVARVLLNLDEFMTRE